MSTVNQFHLEIKNLFLFIYSTSLFHFFYKIRILTVIVVEVGLDLNSVTQFMLALKRKQMKTDDFVYVIPWLAHVSLLTLS